MLVFDNQGEYTPESMERLVDDLGGSFGGDRGRPYAGQPWTASGQRGRAVVVGLTMRDIGDCIARGALMAGDSVRDAAIQSALIEIEKVMGIYPNVPSGPVVIPMLVMGEPTEPPEDAS
jgi:hypothetical protein